MTEPPLGRSVKTWPSRVLHYLTVGDRPGAIPELDGLRGIAILLVLARHAVRPVYETHGELLPIGPWDMAYPLLNGWMGVDLFFVLSGFLVTHHLLRRWPKEFSMNFLGRYWAKRALRTFPAYFATLALVLSGGLAFYELPIDISPSTLLSHSFFMQDYAQGSFVPAFWSLGVEEKFYLLCPFLLLALGRFKLTSGIGILLALAVLPLVLRLITLLLLPHEDWVYGQFFWATRAPFHLAIDGLIWGVACGLLYHRGQHWLKRLEKRTDSIFYIGVLLLAVAIIPVPWFDAELWFASVLVIACVSLAFALIVLAVLLGETPISPVLRMRWLRFFSVISYSLYLVHLILVSLAEDWAGMLPGYAASSSPMQFLTFLPVFLLLSIAAALLLHYTVEKPFLLLKDRI